MPPRPRPRPRPNPIMAPSSPVLAVESDASTSTAPQKIIRVEEDDEDDLFIRSKGRSLKEVHKRAARAYLEYSCKCVCWGTQMCFIINDRGSGGGANIGTHGIGGRG
jgi:hypothetical protein